MARLVILCFVAGLIPLAVVSCGRQAPAGADRDLEEKNRQVEELSQKRQNREKALAAMNVSQLAQDLGRDSERSIEPFNSSAFKQMIARGESAAAELKPLLRDADRRSFLGLLALRQMNGNLYRELDASFRVGVLIDALRTSRYFNTWGLPHMYWEEPAKAIIAENQAAIGPLKALLGDQRAAPMWGSEEAAEYEAYRYRVCDYAWALLVSIRGEKPAVPTDPSARDKLISELARLR